MNTAVTKSKRLLATSLLVMLLALLLAATTTPAQAMQTRSTDVTTASVGNCLVGIDGAFYSNGKAAVLNRINQIRLEACKQGVPDPRDATIKLTEADYVPIKWASDLERIAQTRAAEGSICQGHTRPNGTSCFTAYDNGTITSNSETLAWNYSASMLEGIGQWYDEKSDWVNQNAGTVTGHYTAMINPAITHVGLGCFASDQGWACVAGEYLCDAYYYGTVIAEDEIGMKGTCRQTIELPLSSLAAVNVTGAASLVGAKTCTYKASLVANLASVWGGTHEVEVVPPNGFTWTSSASGIAAVDANGKVTSKKCGVANITATAAGLGKSGSAQLKISPAATKLKSLTAKKKALKVSWNKPASLATGYQIRYSLKKNMKGATVKTVKGASKGTLTIKKLKSKKKYYVQVRSFAKVGGKMYCSTWSPKKAKKVK